MFKNVELRDDFIGVFDTSIHCNQFIDHLKATEENKSSGCKIELFADTSVKRSNC